MSTTALHIIQLVKSLPVEDQKAVREALINDVCPPSRRLEPLFLRDRDGNPYLSDGIPNDDPVFKLLEEIEEERHRDPGPPPPKFD